MRGYIKAVKQLRRARGFWESEETGTFIGNVIFVCLQLPPRSFVLQTQCCCGEEEREYGGFSLGLLF